MSRVFVGNSQRTRLAVFVLPAVALLVLTAACTGVKAPEFKGVSSWINSEPLTLEGLQGKVVLVDFWTYTCVNCIRTFPYLKEWHERYADDGLVIVGVHTPEFEFEKDRDNVLNAMQDHGLTYAVAQDNDYETWDAYGNRFWPAKYLMDQHGTVRYRHFGEGEYNQTERMIRELLVETGADLADDDFPEQSDQALDRLYLELRGGEVTQELYAGFVRGEATDSVRQSEFLKNVGSVVEFEAPDDPKPGYIYFDGAWVIGPEDARHGRETTGYEDSISLVFSAKTVNAVLTSRTGFPYRVRVTLDGQFLTEDNKGTDITIGEDGESYLEVSQPRMYNVVEAPNYVRRSALNMASNSRDFGVFAFTFGVYETGP